MNKFVDSLFKGIEILIAVFLGVMIVLVFMNVVLRYIFNTGFVWSEEIARLCFIYLVYLGAIGAARDNRHLLIDSVLVKLPDIAQKLVYVAIQGCIVWLMGIVSAGSWGLMMQNLNDRWVATHFPTWLVYAAGLVMGVSIIIISVLNVVRLFAMKMSVADLIKVRDDSDGDLPASAE